MNTEQIQAELDRLLPLVLAKGLKRPTLKYMLEAASKPRIQLTWTAGEYQLQQWGYFSEFDEWLNALPTPETAALNAHNDRIADVIDKARDAGIADEYVTPLVAVRAAISTNLLGAA